MFAKLARFPMFNRIVGRRFGASHATTISPSAAPSNRRGVKFCIVIGTRQHPARSNAAGLRKRLPRPKWKNRT
jgi:hypothetical protein